MRFENFADNVSLYASEVMELLEAVRASTDRNNRLVAIGAHELAADPTKTYVPPELEEGVPYLNFAPVQNAVRRLEASAESLDTEMQRVIEEGASDTDIEALNHVLKSTERLMTSEDGLPRRPWYRHQVYAPGFHTGYGVKTLPGIREAIEERDWGEATEQIGLVAEMLDRVSNALEQAARILTG